MNAEKFLVHHPKGQWRMCGHWTLIHSYESCENAFKVNLYGDLTVVLWARFLNGCVYVEQTRQWFVGSPSASRPATAAAANRCHV